MEAPLGPHRSPIRLRLLMAFLLNSSYRLWACNRRRDSLIMDHHLGFLDVCHKILTLVLLSGLALA